MTGQDFNALLGPVLEIVDEKIHEYKRMTKKYEKEEIEKSISGWGLLFRKG